MNYMRSKLFGGWRGDPTTAQMPTVTEADNIAPGPQQSRKPTAVDSTEPATPSWKHDPKALLNPRAAAARAPTPPSTTNNGLRAPGGASSANIQPDDADDDLGMGMGSMIERQHRVTNREAPPAKRRKLEASREEEDTPDAEAPKSKSTINIANSNGILGQHIRDEQKKAAAESGPAPIDLTNDDDDDDCLITASRAFNDDNKQVCLGMLHAKANVHHIPRYPRSQANILGKDTYPQMRLNAKRAAGGTHIIDLFDSSTNNGDKSGYKFAKVELKVASALCPLIDGIAQNGMSYKVYLDAAKKQAGDFEMSRTSRLMSLRILLYSPKRSAVGIGKVLSQRGLFLETPSGVPMGRDIELCNPHTPTVFGGGKPQTSSSKRFQASQPAYGVVRTQEEIVRETTSMFDNLVKSDEIPEMEVDPAAIKTELQGIQKQALHFMTEHEKTEVDDASSLWKQRETPKGTVWANVITNHQLPKHPEPVRGGILADEMGLGKTLSILSLCASTREEGKAFGETEAPAEMETIDMNLKATLIVCPKSVMTNWVQQIKEHTNGRYFKTYQYHGANRTQDLDELAKYDLVLVPYGTVAAEFGFKNGPRKALASANWFRIVLDEAHSIRTSSTQMSRACCALTAQRRWAVTGTPVQNRLDDLGTLIKFLRIKPFDDDTSWGKHIIAPLKMNDENVLQHLQLLVASVTLRRTKEKIGLPGRSEQQIALEFSAEERAMYTQFSSQANLQVRAMTRDKGRIQGKGYAFMLRSIHRLRVICAHGQEMLSEDDLKELEGLTAQTAIDLGDEPDGEEGSKSFITETQAYDFLHMMIESASDVCTGCGKSITGKGDGAEAVREPSSEEESTDDGESDEDDVDSETAARRDVLGYINPCYDHLICPDCKDIYVHESQKVQRVDGYHPCMYCEKFVQFGLYELKRSALQSFLDSKAPKNKKQRTKWDESSYSGPHTKVKALVQDLKQSAIDSETMHQGEPPIKSVIFSGWTTYLDLIEYALEENNITYNRLDGTMSIKQRTAVLDAFRSDDAISVILVSIKAGGQGLNLTSASKVYMMEPQFNPGVEQQAIDRVHRMGQTRDVTIKHFIMKDSIEQQIQKMQERKKDLAKLALDKKMSKGEAAKQRIEELREMFK